MRPRILIPLFVLVLACVSPHAFAGGSGNGHGAHVHIHQHGGMVHEHIHADHDQDDVPAPASPLCPGSEDEGHHHCCGDHSHYPEKVGDALNNRNEDMPTFSMGIVSSLPDFFRFPTREILLRWAPLHQRPPDHLRALRTCVMLN